VHRGFFGLCFCLVTGCSSLDNCPAGRQDIVADDTHALRDVERLLYESAPDDGPLQEFPAKTQIVFEHGLGVVPSLKEAFLSFKLEGTNGAGGGSISEAAGNEALWECVDSKVMVVKNDTCEKSFFIKVVALGAPNGSTKVSCGY